MCKKSKFPLVFNIFLAFFITLVVTIFVKAGEGALTPESFIIGMIQGFCLNMTLETIIDLPAMGNKFVRALGVKKMEGPAAYFLRLLAIVFVIVLLISFLLMFCEIGFAMGATSNAMANMQVIDAKYGSSPSAFFIVPLVGSLFINLVNSGIITVFLNLV